MTRPARPVVRQIANTCIALDRNATIATAVVSQALRITYLHAGPESAADVVQWIADRFAGKPPPSTC